MTPAIKDIKDFLENKGPMEWDKWDKSICSYQYVSDYTLKPLGLQAEAWEGIKVQVHNDASWEYWGNKPHKSKVLRIPGGCWEHYMLNCVVMSNLGLSKRKMKSPSVLRASGISRF